MSGPIVRRYGDHAVIVEWNTDGFSVDVNDTIHAVAEQLRQSDQFIEIVPGYDSLVCLFDLGGMSFETAKLQVETALSKGVTSAAKTGKLIEIPVHYGGENGPDMDNICQSSKLSMDKVIAKHSAEDYRVCMMGFIPGFTFLSPAPKKLHHPRHATPRAVIPAGSIGIANWQTGIYGLESPGGWQIIGRTPHSIFDAAREEPFLISAGDRVRFVPQ